jgi:esterase/lipase superfamily enzyme
LGFDLKVKGPVGFFSWPSRGYFAGYFKDGSGIEGSEGAIIRFLVDFAERSGTARVSVIAHSMGNRGLLRGLQEVIVQAEAESSTRFRHFVLAAPDVTRALFLRLAHLYGRVATRTTLYISDRDRALKASHWLQGDRVGFAPPVTVYPGIDTIHTAYVDRTFLGHSSFAESRPVITDLQNLLLYDAPPDSRLGLREETTADGEKYWIIAP